ncbi:MAG: hypothetical protein V7K48_24360 [Nostoc sp.]|uniref:hypothetical protein n=1 Tax=Nostoc sp. TaxID=1180 RepID=UPI002FF7BBA1
MMVATKSDVYDGLRLLQMLNNCEYLMKYSRANIAIQQITVSINIGNLKSSMQLLAL